MEWCMKRMKSFLKLKKPLDSRIRLVVEEPDEETAFRQPKKIPATSYDVHASSSSYPDVLKTLTSLKFGIHRTAVVGHLDTDSSRGIDNCLLKEFLKCSHDVEMYIKSMKNLLSDYENNLNLAIDTNGEFEYLALPVDDYLVVKSSLQGDLKVSIEERKVTVLKWYNATTILKYVVIGIFLIVSALTFDHQLKLLGPMIENFHPGHEKSEKEKAKDKYEASFMLALPVSIVATYVTALFNSWLDASKKSIKIVNTMDTCRWVLCDQFSQIEKLIHNADIFRNADANDYVSLRPQAVRLLESLNLHLDWMDEFLVLIRQLNDSVVSRF